VVVRKTRQEVQRLSEDAQEDETAGEEKSAEPEHGTINW